MAADQLRTVSLEDLDRFQLDAEGNLYWDGKRVKTILRLTFLQKLGAVLVTIAALVGGMGAAAQGWAATNEWTCKLGWVVTWCPPKT